MWFLAQSYKRGNRKSEVLVRQMSSNPTYQELREKVISLQMYMVCRLLDGRGRASTRAFHVAWRGPAQQPPIPLPCALAREQMRETPCPLAAARSLPGQSPSARTTGLGDR